MLQQLIADVVRLPQGEWAFAGSDAYVGHQPVQSGAGRRCVSIVFRKSRIIQYGCLAADPQAGAGRVRVTPDFAAPIGCGSVFNMTNRACRRLVCLALLLLSQAPVYAVSDAEDLAADGRRAATAKTPIVVMFSADHCPYCEVVRRDYIEPLPQHPQYGQRVIVRVVTIDSDYRLIDFSGARTTHTHFAFEEGVSLVPTVRFYGVNGERLAADLVGALLPDFYLHYLEGAINKASGKLGSVNTSRD